MPRNVVFIPGFTALEQQANFRRSAAIGDAFRGIGQTLLYYSERKKQEDSENLSLLSNMISTYGANVGQPALEAMDSTLKRRGLPGLPKDTVTGGFLPPPESLDAKISGQVTKDPELLKSLAIKKATGMSPVEQNLKQQIIDATNKKTGMMADIAKTRADAEVERARTGLVSALTTRKMKILDQQLKKHKLHLDVMKATDAFAHKAEAEMLSIVKVYVNPKTQPEQRKAMEPIIRHTLRGAGIEEENIDKFLKQGPEPTSWRNGILAKITGVKALMDYFDTAHAAQGVQSTEDKVNTPTKKGEIPDVPGAELVE